jgi:hypothetical protein
LEVLHDTLTAQIGGNVTGISLDKGTAVYFNRDAQTATLLDACDLQGTLALCGVDRDGNPMSLATIKQVVKHSKVFRNPRAASTLEPDPNQTTI